MYSLIPISVQPIYYLKPRLFDLTEFILTVHDIKLGRYRDQKILICNECFFILSKEVFNGTIYVISSDI